jgi:hypothetical protein
MRFNRITGSGFIFYEPPHEVAIYNNTVVKALGYGLQIWGQNLKYPQSTDFTDMQIKNNIFAYRDGGFMVQCAGKAQCNTVDMDQNLWRFSANGISWEGYGGNYGPSLSEFQRFQHETNQEANGKWTNATLTELFENPTNRNYHLTAGSPAIDAGGPLTTTTSAGSGTIIPVVKSWYFQDGYDGLIEADLIKVGVNTPVRIVSIDYSNHTLTVDTAISWNAGDWVSLPYSGVAPDAGAYEFQESQSALAPPQNLRVVNQP